MTRRTSYTDDAFTIGQAFNERVKLTPDKAAYTEFNHQTKKWQSYTWDETRTLAASVQQWLSELGIAAGDRIGLMLPNSVMWVAIDQAAAGMGIITVPLYPNDREDNVHYILEKTDCRLLMISSQEQCELAKDFIDEIESLNSIVLIDDIGASDGLPILKNQLKKFDDSIFISDSCSCNDPATIVFTSGTTGRPKGVILSHRNLLVNAADSGRAMPVGEEDQLLSFLPLSHTFERTTGYYAPMLHGAEITYTRSIDQLAEDLQIIKPTILISVPRIYERVYAKIIAQVQSKSAIAQRLFSHAHEIGYKKFCYQQGTGGWSISFLLHPLLDEIVAKKIREKLGGRLKFAVAGGAAFAKELNAFFIGMGVNVVQGYGMTESSPVISANRVDKNIVGSVGIAFDNVEVKLSGVGELMVRGDSVMQGYWDNEEATKEVLTEDGWLHTGDIARIEDGIIYITGRVKDIIVLSNGEKIPPADVEHAVCSDALFDQAIVIGERKPFLSTIVVLNSEQCKLQRINTNNLNSEEVKSQLLKKISAYMDEFPGYAQIYQITATFEPWEVENGLLTPTLKIKREKVKQLFKKEIDAMYAGH
ncbi:MAG: long-chain fatty acid--CoA ligase [Gammaproteobacteria bacterium]|nr:long-chain fatty acid--CoA ligase [Gammaproteobacteria bacterium]